MELEAQILTYQKKKGSRWMVRPFFIVLGPPTLLSTSRNIHRIRANSKISWKPERPDSFGLCMVVGGGQVLNVSSIRHFYQQYSLAHFLPWSYQTRQLLVSGSQFTKARRTDQEWLICKPGNHWRKLDLSRCCLTSLTPPTLTIFSRVSYSTSY